MKIGKDGIDLIKSFESCARAHKTDKGMFVAYLPTKDDVPTIGWGSTGKDITMSTVFSQKQCDDRLAADLATFSAKVDALVGGAKTSQHQFDAMVSLAYNIGTGNFATSSVLKAHKAGDGPAASAAFGRWVKQRDKKTNQLITLEGLVRRRHAEAALYLG